jgi:hypothetical protein
MPSPKLKKFSYQIYIYLHPKSKKSILSSIINSFISGIATTTFGFPPNFSRFASISPKVLETESLPGNTLKGPYMIFGFSSLSFTFVAKTALLSCPG